MIDTNVKNSILKQEKKKEKRKKKGLLICFPPKDGIRPYWNDN